MRFKLRREINRERISQRIKFCEGRSHISSFRPRNITPYFSNVHFNIILPSTHTSPLWCLPLGYSDQNVYVFLIHVLRVLPICSLIYTNLVKIINYGTHSWLVFSILCNALYLWSKYPSQHFALEHSRLYKEETKFHTHIKLCLSITPSFYGLRSKNSRRIIFAYTFKASEINFVRQTAGYTCLYLKGN